MTIDPSVLSGGMSYLEFVAGMTRNQERIQQLRSSITLLDDERAVFAALAKPLDVLVLAENWCSDVVAGLPILDALREASGDRLRLHIYLRDQHPELMDQFLNQGRYRSIPVFAFFNEDHQEIGRFIERPSDLNAQREQRRTLLYANHPEMGEPETPIESLSREQQEARRQLLSELDHELYETRVRLTIRDLRSIAEKGT